MKDPIYKIFISSTQHDLLKIREKLIYAIVDMGHIPVCMETFPAGPNAMEFVKSVIDECHYFILLIRGRYGNIYSDGKSFTHLEFEYACTKLPWCAIVPKDPSLSQNAITINDEEFQNLKKFIKEISDKRRILKFWQPDHDEDDITNIVIQALRGLIDTTPQTGLINDFPINKSGTLFYNQIILDIKTLRENTIKNNDPRKRFQLLTYNWIIKNLVSEATVDQIENEIKINILQPTAKLRNIYGSIVTRLNANDNYHTLSTLDFWLDDLGNETKFIEDNLHAIKSGVKISRIILINKKIFGNPKRYQDKLIGLDSLINTFYKYSYSFANEFKKLETKFLILKEDEIDNYYNEAPFAIVSSDFIKGKRQTTPNSIVSERACVMLIKSTKRLVETNQENLGINIIFYDENTHNKIYQLEKLFLELRSRQSIMSLGEMKQYLEEHKVENKWSNNHPGNISNYEYSIFISEYSMVKGCLSQSNLPSILLSNFTAAFHDKSDNSWTIIDQTSNINKLLEEQILTDIPSSPKAVPLIKKDELRLIKIDIPNAIEKHGVLAEISAIFADKKIPICLFSTFNSELILYDKNDHESVLGALGTKKIEPYYIEDKTPY